LLVISGIEHSSYQQSLPRLQRAYCTLRVSDPFFKATRKGYTGASFYLMTTAANYTKIGEHLNLSYQAHKRHIQYSLCLSLEQKTLCYRAYFEARLNLFAKAILCLDDPGMQVIFSGDVLSTRRILPTLPIRR
jgi:hypothetical protein